MRRGLRTIVFCCACLTMLALPGSAAAAIELESFTFGTSSSQAGAHPDVSVEVSFTEPEEPETTRDAVVDLPPGLFLYPWTLPRCGPQQLAADNCPIDSQVGVIDIHEAHFGSLEKTPVYLATPEPGELARLAFHSLGFTEPFEVPVRASAANGYALSLAFEELPEAMPVSSLELVLWGVPPAAVHDQERGPHPEEAPGGGRSSGLLPTPFTRNPTACEATSAGVSANSYEEPSEFAMATTSGPTISGCRKLPFEPASTLMLSSDEAASPAGIGLDYQVAQNLFPDGLAPSDTAAIALYLPPGLTVDEAAAAQQAACTPAQANLATDSPASCPPESKIGTFETALAGGDGALEGSVYFGGLEAPSEYRLFLVGSGGGLELKLPAWLSAGSETELVFPELPQLPLEVLDLQIDPAAAFFLTPPRCGTFEAGIEAVDWSQPDLASIFSIPFTIGAGPGGGPCPEPAGPPANAVTPAPSAPAAAKLQAPVVTLRKHPARRGHDRTPSFRFVSSVAGSRFKCKLDRHPWRPCQSPLTLRPLALGSHVFRVKAIAAGVESPAVTYRFAIAPVRRAA
jgi:hypothetical protein